MTRAPAAVAFLAAGTLFLAGWPGPPNAHGEELTPDGSGARDAPYVEELRTVREGVTAGALTAPPVEYSYQSGADATNRSGFGYRGPPHTRYGLRRTAGDGVSHRNT